MCVLGAPQLGDVAVCLRVVIQLDTEPGEEAQTVEVVGEAPVYVAVGRERRAVITGSPVASGHQ